MSLFIIFYYPFLILTVILFTWLILICYTLIAELTTHSTYSDTKYVKLSNNLLKEVFKTLLLTCAYYSIMRDITRCRLSSGFRFSPYYKYYCLNNQKFNNEGGINIRIIILCIIAFTLSGGIAWIIFCCYRSINPLPLTLWCIIWCAFWLSLDILL